MLQVIQYQKTGEITIEALPRPQLRSGGVLVRNLYSLISAGTERNSVETAQASLLGKVRSRPDLVRQVMDNFYREGLVATYEKVKTRLDNYKDLGYSSTGVVVESSVDEFRAGDRVACSGVGYASHAEMVFVPKGLTVRIPDKVGFEDAAFAALGAIAMQGVRQADARVAERVAVLGLGLIGLLTVQLLKASGCSVFGLDISEHNFQLARQLGCDMCAVSAHEAVPSVEKFTQGFGADAVIITAATTSNSPIELATKCARKKGRVVIVGAVSMDIPRMPSYEKELDFRMSCSCGPGRYDADYEIHGRDYPQAYVRWTEKRNMEAVLDLIAQKKVDVKSLVTHTFGVQDALEAYDIVTHKTKIPHLGILINYPTPPESTVQHIGERHAIDLPSNGTSRASGVAIGVIGAGNHTQSYLLPTLENMHAGFEIVATSKPVNSKSVGAKFGFRACTTDPAQVLNHDGINLVIIGTRHDSHSRYVVEALRAGKHVFVEKPLAISPQELDQVVTAYEETVVAGLSPVLAVGYNRRFSSAMRAIEQFFAEVSEPLVLNYRVNAGFQPPSNWYQDPVQGGRLIGEIGHFIDCMQFLTGASPRTIFAIGPDDPGRRYSADNVQVSLTFTDGSVGQISYVANGASAMAKEYLEVFGEGKSATLDNFKRVNLFDGRKKKALSFSGNKGHCEEMKALCSAVLMGTAPIPVESLIATSRASFAVVESLRNGAPVMI